MKLDRPTVTVLALCGALLAGAGGIAAVNKQISIAEPPKQSILAASTDLPPPAPIDSAQALVESPPVKVESLPDNAGTGDEFLPDLSEPDASEPGSSAEPASDPMPEREPVKFSSDTVLQLAKTLSQTPFKTAAPLPDGADELDYDQYRRIEYIRERAEWADDHNSLLQIQYDPRGYLFEEQIAIHIVEDGVVTPRAYTPEDFRFFDLEIPDEAKENLGFAGFRISTLLNEPGKFDDLISFRGASFFRVLSAGSVYGASARGLAIRTASPSGEEFPIFREFWIEKPRGGQDSIIIHALMDSISATGAYTFEVFPGLQTRVVVDAVIYPRKDLSEVGMAPITSMFFFGPQDKSYASNDFRPAVHDSEGLMVHMQNGEWIWRPLVNPSQLEISSFAHEPPVGFGLVQRSRSFNDYQDLEANYHKRPSVWIEPKGDWGKGHLTLVEIPTPNEYNDNIVAFWRPDGVWTKGSAVPFSYEMIWTTASPAKPPLASVTATRVGKTLQSGNQHFVIEFDTPNPELFANAAPLVTASKGEVLNTQLIQNQHTNGLRLSFELDAGDANISELRAQITLTDRPTSETWLYRWRP